MSDDTPAVSALVERLEQIEVTLQHALRANGRHSCTQFSLEELGGLKAAIDRLRPLLWMYVGRFSDESKDNAAPAHVSTVRSLIKEAVQISDRYMLSGS